MNTIRLTLTFDCSDHVMQPYYNIATKITLPEKVSTGQSVGKPAFLCVRLVTRVGIVSFVGPYFRASGTQYNYI